MDVVAHRAANGNSLRWFIRWQRWRIPAVREKHTLNFDQLVARVVAISYRLHAYNGFDVKDVL
jgi:hypothetical protein